MAIYHSILGQIEKILYKVREWSLVAAVVTMQCGSNFNTNEASLLKIH